MCRGPVIDAPAEFVDDVQSATVIFDRRRQRPNKCRRDGGGDVAFVVIGRPTVDVIYVYKLE